MEVKDEYSRLRWIEASARDLHNFLHKTVGGEGAPLQILGEDIYVEGMKNRLQELMRSLLIYERHHPGNVPSHEVVNRPKPNHG